MNLWDDTAYTYLYYMTGLIISMGIWIKILADLNRHSDSKMMPDLPVAPEVVMLGLFVNALLWPIVTPLFLAAWLARKMR